MCLICLIRCRKRVTACCCWCVIPRNCVLRFLAHLFLLRCFSQFTDAFLSPILACFAQLSRKDFAELARQVPLRCFTRSQQLLRCGWLQSAPVILNAYILDPDANLYRTRWHYIFAAHCPSPRTRNMPTTQLRSPPKSTIPAAAIASSIPSPSKLQPAPSLTAKLFLRIAI